MEIRGPRAASACWPFAGCCCWRSDWCCQTAGFGFVNLDDPEYVYENQKVQNGVTIEGIRWAFAEKHMANWHPLTWISLMLDCGLYGRKPAGHHLTNVLLHAAAVILLFLVLRRMTGRLWPSALVATLFAIHPLRAESVAWVTERKDVLSGLFFALTLGAYDCYVRRPFSFARYAAVMVCLAMGLLLKATLVTVPCVLLLLDYWPLGRVATGEPRPPMAPCGTTANLGSSEDSPDRFSVLARLLAEKLSLLVLAALASAMTVSAQPRRLNSASSTTYGGGCDTFPLLT